MKHITLKNEEVTISFDDNVSKRYTTTIEGEIIRCLKHLYRYNQFQIPKDIMASILLKALRGTRCKQDHFDISQRLSLYEYFKGKSVDDPYIQQFINETKDKKI